MDKENIYIGVEYDHEFGWIVTLPKIYADGIEQETESKHNFLYDAIEESKRISKNTGLPIKAYDKQGKPIK